MCGIAGIWAGNRDVTALRARMARMLKALAHRGPDDEGLWCAPENDLVLGHRRLSVLDLSCAAHQPMISGDGRYVLVFNGEIYNYQEIRGQLERLGSPGWCSTGDTEVLLRALSVWGVEALDRLDGMFSLAFYDVRQRSLLLARDPFGEKPLYLAGGSGPFWAFSSTLPSLLESLPSFPEIDDTAVVAYWRQYAIASPQTVYKNIEAVPAGAWVRLSPRGRSDGVYWQPVYTEPQATSFAEAVDRAREALKSSLRRRLIADVPLGCFLSGGVDSSLATAMTAREFRTQLNTFSIGFTGQQDGDYPFAQRVARQYGTHHEAIWLDAATLEELPRILWHFGQPFADYACVPTYFISRLARTKVTVAITGEGGDELFAGYVAPMANDLADRVRRVVPFPLRRFAQRCTSPWTRRLRGSGLLRRLAILAKMAALDPSEAYDALADLVCLLDHRWQGQASLTWRGRYFDERPDWPVLQRALYCEMRGRMTDRFLLKVDTSAMAHSLETRTPFLSRELFDCVRGLGRDVLLHGNTRKAVLRKIAEEYLPRDLIYRRKLGFTPPMGRWLLEPRYARILDWILGPRSPAAPWLDMDRLRCLGEAHRSAVQDHGEELFAILSFCLWWKLSVERTLAPSVPLSEVAVAA